MASELNTPMKNCLLHKPFDTVQIVCCRVLYFNFEVVACGLQLRFGVGNISVQSSFGGSISGIDPALAVKLLLVDELK